MTALIFNVCLQALAVVCLIIWSLASTYVLLRSIDFFLPFRAGCFLLCFIAFTPTHWHHLIRNCGGTAWGRLDGAQHPPQGNRSHRDPWHTRQVTLVSQIFIQMEKPSHSRHTYLSPSGFMMSRPATNPQTPSGVTSRNKDNKASWKFWVNFFPCRISLMRVRQVRWTWRPWPWCSGWRRWPRESWRTSSGASRMLNHERLKDLVLENCMAIEPGPENIYTSKYYTYTLQLKCMFLVFLWPWFTDHLVSTM